MGSAIPRCSELSEPVDPGQRAPRPLFLSGRVEELDIVPSPERLNPLENLVDSRLVQTYQRNIRRAETIDNWRAEATS